MAEQEESSFPTNMAWAQYHEGATNSGAVAAQFDVVGNRFQDQALEWGENTCKAVAFLCCCEHTSCPPALSGAGTVKELKAEAAAHPGLCGVHHTCFITGAKFEDVLARGNGVPSTKMGFPNRACYEASKSKALNCNGGGVQLKRHACFTEACRALFLGDAPIPDWMAGVFIWYWRHRDRSLSNVF